MWIKNHKTFQLEIYTKSKKIIFLPELWMHCLNDFPWQNLTWYVLRSTQFLHATHYISTLLSVLLNDTLLLGCCTRFLCILVKGCSQLAKIRITFILSTPTGWTNWLINYVHISKLNWQQIFPCQYICKILNPISIVLFTKNIYDYFYLMKSSNF